jgi:hypothetical protein
MIRPSNKLRFETWIGVLHEKVILRTAERIKLSSVS